MPFSTVATHWMGGEVGFLFASFTLKWTIGSSEGRALFRFMMCLACMLQGSLDPSANSRHERLGCIFVDIPERGP